MLLLYSSLLGDVLGPDDPACMRATTAGGRRELPATYWVRANRTATPLTFRAVRWNGGGFAID
jgi:hypothetical protein